MLDIETLGLGAFPVITNIGAVGFDVSEPGYDQWQGTFDMDVSIQSCLDLGMAISADTLRWWAKQPGYAAMMEKQENAVDIRDALEAFRTFYGADDRTPIWSKGADFDIVVVRNIYRRLWSHGAEPWNYQSTRCFRTFQNILTLKDPSVIPVEAEHTGLGDAKWQANYLRTVVWENRKITEMVKNSLEAANAVVAADKAVRESVEKTHQSMTEQALARSVPTGGGPVVEFNQEPA
jgi:hypothetical protein